MRKFIIFLCISCFSFPMVSAYTISEIYSKIWEIQASSSIDPSSIWGNDPKWFVWTVLANIFNTSYQIKNVFIAALDSLDGNYINNILKWDGDSFVVSNMADTSTGVFVNNNMKVNGDIIANNIFDPAGNKLWSKFQDGTGTWEIYYSWWNVGIGTNNPETLLDVRGALKLTGAWISDIRIQGWTWSPSTANIALLWNILSDKLVLNYQGGYLQWVEVQWAGGLHVTNKITMWMQTENGDTDDTIATKWYVDNLSLYDLYMNQTWPETQAGDIIAWRNPTRYNTNTVNSWINAGPSIAVASWNSLRINYEWWERIDGTHCYSQILVNGVNVFSASHWNNSPNWYTSTDISVSASDVIQVQFRNRTSGNTCNIRNIEIWTASWEFTPMIPLPRAFEYLVN